MEGVVVGCAAGVAEEPESGAAGEVGAERADAVELPDWAAVLQPVSGSAARPASMTRVVVAKVVSGAERGIVVVSEGMGGPVVWSGVAGGRAGRGGILIGRRVSATGGWAGGGG